MMTYVGLALLVAILVLRWGFGSWRVQHLRRWWHKGQAAMNGANLVAAEAAFRECVRRAPIAAPAHRALGAVLARRGKLTEAEEHLRFAADLEPRNPDGFIDLGFFLATCVPNRAEDAINAFASAVASAPNLRKLLSEEPRLGPLRRYERFRKLLESAP